eukprot:2431008-Pyramimonas_sp.AAC.1
MSPWLFLLRLSTKWGRRSVGGSPSSTPVGALVRWLDVPRFRPRRRPWSLRAAHNSHHVASTTLLAPHMLNHMNCKGHHNYRTT